MWKTLLEKLSQRRSGWRELDQQIADFNDNAAARQQRLDDLQQQAQQAMANSQTITTGSGLIYNGTLGSTSGSYTVTGGNISPSYTYTANISPQPYTDVEWEISDVQKAAGMGWFLVGGQNSVTPQLMVHPHGTKTQLSEDDLLADVVQQAIGGECPIAYKLLCVLTKNRSPYAQYEATTKELAEDYE